LSLLDRVRGATLDLTPLRESKPFRRLILGESVSVIGRIEAGEAGDEAAIRIDLPAGWPG